MIKVFSVVFLLTIPAYTNAQPKELCNGIDALVKDAPGGFKSVKDTIIRINERGITWACKVHIPGIMAGRIVSIMGLRYEGALFQSKDLATVQLAYGQYKTELNGCLLDKGYQLSYGDNFYKGLETLKKLVYILPTKDDAIAPPPHVSVETDFAKQSGVYTIILYVWQH
jgi:hypothetical protein